MMSSLEPPHNHPQAAAVPVNPHAVIRALRPADRARHDELVAELDRLHHEALPSLIKPPAQARVPDDDFAQRLSDPLVFLRGYELDGALVGLIRAVLQEKPESRAYRASRLVRVDELIVTRHARGNRIGYTLLQAAQTWGQDVEASSIELTVHAFNIAAMDFYTAAGFRPRTLVLSRKLAQAL